ncbi:c-type cytochrome [Azospirillum sp.]|uniref:c-type cytochrome n=1 Tax=Azospirillum sp. TaxID=34012 RepID=UPI002D41814B|nr:c-type cytochrome [Azospirillum sp.]HYD70822.1 c-type cytochrome [Azospirillum sp.]
MKRLAAGALLLAVLPHGPAGAADARNGRAIAERWCTACHVVAEGQAGSDAAPSLPQVARNRATDQRWLRAWLTDPHPPMPNLNLSRGDIDDLVAYLERLAR